ncbi:threonine/serine exporter family protein [Intrasporangium sp. YIM S08009]|uniref:threonine/serine exporter family protein n=1 Tax=Intrasporangium zincisolvens TaxID=3080018 RepID=UPI002B05F867|nr:threonine/serine exporter family protein [Intrasporangium sp. YIM S08009]
MKDGGDVAFDVLHRLAEVLLANSGEGVVLVEGELRRAAAALGSDLEPLALPEQLVLSGVSRPGSVGRQAMVVVHATPGIARLDRVSAAHEVVDSLGRGLPAATALARLEAIAAAPPPLGWWARVLGVALFAGGFAPSVVATASEVVAAIALGLLMGLMLVAAEGRILDPLLPAISAAVLTGVAFAIRPGIVDLAGPVLVVLPALFVVLPGDTLSAGAGELLAGRITSGTGRVMWSFFILAQMVVGIVAAAEVAGAGAAALTEQEVPAELPFLVVLLAWIPFTAGLALVFRARTADLGWVLAGVLGTFLLQQAVTRAVGDVSGTLVAGAALGAYATWASRSRWRPPRLVVVLGGFFVLTVGGLGLRGATALVGGHAITGVRNLVDFALQMPTVALGIGFGFLVAGRRWLSDSQKSAGPNDAADADQ